MNNSGCGALPEILPVSSSYRLSASFTRSSALKHRECNALSARGNSRTCRKNWVAKLHSPLCETLPVGDSMPNRMTPEGAPLFDHRENLAHESVIRSHG